MRAIAVPLPGLPLHMICAEDATISFSKTFGFRAIIDHHENGCCAIITDEDIFIGADTIIEYGVRYHYKGMPELLAWLQAQKLEMPVFN